MTEDKFEKWLIDTSKEKHEHFRKYDMHTSYAEYSAYDMALIKYRAFKSEKPTAPASLVERLNKWSEGCYGYTDNPSKCPAMDEFEKIIREAESKARQYLMGLQDKEGR